MTGQEVTWFNELSAKRKTWHESTFENNFGEIWDVITSPYSDQAHFVYELLQNADDCGATDVKFELSHDQLVFTHNGKKRFSISNPNTMTQDAETGALGHVNAITGVSNSTKDVNSIGKFGIGFKSVFLYTETPYVYDDGMCFKIENFIVPTRLTEDLPGRRQGTTVFVFPFNRKGPKAPANPANEVFLKLKSLILPTFFLRNLKTITWTYGAYSGSFHKEEDRIPLGKCTEEPMAVSRISLKKTLQVGSISEATVDSFLMFSRKLPQRDLFYSVAFGLDGNGDIKPVQYNPFCYFPTKVPAVLNFVINAPFLLTSSREGISEATEAHIQQNQGMLDRIAKLLADSIVGLRDLSEKMGKRYLSDNFISQTIIPLTEPRIEGWQHLNLQKFYTEPHGVFMTKRVIPCDNGYCEKQHAYVAELMNMTEAFDDTDLQAFERDRSVRWVFKTISFADEKRRGESRDMMVRHYILSITKNGSPFGPMDVLAKVGGRFIESRWNEIDWLRKFYRWVGKISRNSSSKELSKRSQIFLNRSNRAVAAVNDLGEPQLFLPIEGDTTFAFPTIHPQLHQLEEVKELELVFDMRKPKLLDQVAKYVAKARRSSQGEKDTWVRALISLACSGSITFDDRAKIIEELKKPEIGQFKDMEDVVSFKPASELYLQSDRLREFFGGDSNGCFIDQQHYYSSQLSPNDVEKLLKEIGISDKIHLDWKNIDLQSNNENNSEARNRYLRYLERHNFKTPQDKPKRLRIPCCSCIERRLLWIKRQVDAGIIHESEVLTEAQSQSLQIWNMLNDIVANNLDSKDIKSVFESTYRYKPWHGQSDREKKVRSPLHNWLLSVPWIWCKDGSFKKAKDISTALLRDEFTSASTCHRVCELLDIRAVDSETVRKVLDKYGEYKTYSMGKILEEAGILDENDVRRAIELLKAERVTTLPKDKPTPPSTEPPKELPPGTEDIEAIKALKDKIHKSREKTKQYKKEKARRLPHDEPPKTKMLPSEDEDVLQPKPVNFQEKMDELLKKQQEQIDQLNAEAELQTRAVSAEEYSYAWLKSRIDLEIHANGADDDKSREASVSFAKMEREEGSENMFILSATSDAIPQWFEEETNQRLTIRIPGHRDIETVIESMSVLSFRLRAKVKILPGMENIDYSKVVEARTVATRPDFLLGSLKEGVEALGYEDSFDLKANLPEDIKFVFGPPGTGKTTYLAREEIIPLAQSEDQPHVLVLTPTNKAADVLTSRIIKECGNDEGYKKWLTRFGMTTDTELQKSPVARAKDAVIKDGQSAVVVATIIRFAYDLFTSMGGIKLRDFKWDYVIFDEASMIPLMQILYPIFKCKDNETKFIIAGDPMQIAPVVLSDLSVGENIYTMVKLEDFATPTTEPRQYEVVRLYEQFRSVPCIGRIFSEFAYQGLLKHHRAAAEEQSLSVHGLPDIAPLTVMRFPVSRFESIFKIKLLGKSSYQIYSALFVFEYICKLADGLRNAGRTGFRIGVISPYRAQANIVERLIARLDKTRLEGVDVHVGTVHGFQGDECEMIIALLNPPQGMGRKEGSFINDKKVLNVAISRARDYLVLAIPDANTRNVQFLRGPLNIYELMRHMPGVFTEFQTPDLEESVWGDKDYIEKNTFSTGHQNVNVYETPEKRFEVRSEDVAVDIHFRPDRQADTQDASFVSERERIEVEAKAEDLVRKKFVVPPGFHTPRSDELVPVMKQYYVIGQEDKPKFCEDETEDIDPSQVLAIED